MDDVAQRVRVALGGSPGSTDRELIAEMRRSAGLTRDTARVDLWMKPVRNLQKEAGTPLSAQAGDQGLFAFAILDEAKHEDRQAWIEELRQDGIAEDEVFRWLSRYVRERVANPAARAGIVRFDESDPF